MITLTAGTAFIMWLGEQITERGIGNGISLIIFAGIVAALPVARSSTTLEFVREGELSHLRCCSRSPRSWSRVVGVDHLRGARPAAHPGAVRQARRRPAHVRRPELASAAQDQHRGRHPADLRVVAAVFPATHRAVRRPPVGAGVPQAARAGRRWLYNLLYVALIIFFCYFYTAVTFNPTDVADNMKKFGGYIPGIRPGQRTAEYIDRILSRITLAGALYVAAVCVLPTILIRQFNVPFYFGGTALLIVVGVALDTVAQIETHLSPAATRAS